MSAMISAHAGARAGFAGVNAANRQTAMDSAHPPQQSAPDVIKNEHLSDLARTNDKVLDVLESQAFNYGVTAATGVFVTVKGGMVAAAASSSAAVGAATAGGLFVVGVGVGMAAGYVGSTIGDAAGHHIAGLLGWEKVAAEGEHVARVGG